MNYAILGGDIFVKVGVHLERLVGILFFKDGGYVLDNFYELNNFFDDGGQSSMPSQISPDAQSSHDARPSQNDYQNPFSKSYYINPGDNCITSNIEK
jgi:hypothetical protein